MTTNQNANEAQQSVNDQTQEARTKADIIMRNRQEPVFSIRIAARLVGLHVQTLRYYERNGMVKPQRSRGNVRYYSEEDITMINNIKSLIDDLGVNLAGVQVIMRMNEQMSTMKEQIKYLLLADKRVPEKEIDSIKKLITSLSAM